MGIRKLVKWKALTAAALLLVSTSALAQAAVTPATYETTLSPGESVTIDKLVDVPHTAEKVDIYFLADTTGSMGPVLAQAKADAASVLSSLTGSISDVQFGAGDYKDFPNDPYAFHNAAPIGPDDGVGGAADASDAINAWTAGGGSDGPEGQFYALDQIASNPAIGWRPGAQRIVVWFGDAPAHDPVCSAISGLGYNITESSVTAKLVSQQITVVAISTTTGYPNGLDDDPTLGEFDYNSYCPIGGSPGQATRITGATGGAFLTGVAPADIASSILSGISEVTVDVVADASDCSPNLDVSYVPPEFTNVAGPTTVDFQETIAVPDGTPVGDYTCTVVFTASGGFLGTQTITVHVPDLTPPTAACVETNNPSGKNVPTAGPNAGKSGQNPDGFYQVTASDAETGVASVVLQDTASDAAFALADGDKIKVTQAPGANPSMKPGAGDIDWQIKLKGDGLLVVTDNAGNVTQVTCLVPQPAK